MPDSPRPHTPDQLQARLAETGRELARAEEALRHGLINYAVSGPELDPKTDWLINRLADKSPTAIRRGKYAMRALASMSFDEALAFTESQIALLALTEDAKEGLASFSEKRKPVWSGR